MSNCIAFSRANNNNRVKAAPELKYYSGVITAWDEQQQRCTVDNVADINIADSLLVKPEVGDVVAYINCSQGNFVIQILLQSNAVATHLSSSLPLKINAPCISIAARDELDMVSLNRFSLVSKHGAISVAGTLVTCAESLVQQVNQLILNARGMLRMSAKQQVITAEEDVRIDGKRINMG
jgi:hypothetical protein